MSRYRWRTTLEGMVVIAEPPAYVDERAPVLDFAGSLKMAAIERDWGSLCRETGQEYQVPDGWLQAMIYRESGGDRSAYRVERDRQGKPISVAGRLLTGIGLMQITHPALKRGLTDAEVFVPSVNLKIAANYISNLIERYGKDFPKIAAAYNSGSVKESDQNPWGMHSTGAHITVEVQALNTWIKQRSDLLGLTVPRTLFDLTQIAREADEAARSDTIPCPPPDDAA